MDTPAQSLSLQFPVVEPLSHMAQLAAYMLPLAPQRREPPAPTATASRPGTSRPQAKTPIVVSPPSSRAGSVPYLHTSPVSLDDEMPPLVTPLQKVKEEPMDLALKDAEEAPAQVPPLVLEDSPQVSSTGEHTPEEKAPAQGTLQKTPPEEDKAVSGTSSPTEALPEVTPEATMPRSPR